MNSKGNIKFPLTIECEKCGSQLEIDEEDIVIKVLGLPGVICPVCGKWTAVDELEDEYSVNITKDNIEFPDHFFHSVNGVDLDKDEIKKYINDGIEWFRKNPEAFVYTTGTGNTGIMIQNYSGDEEYHAIVTKDYYDTFIPYEKEDYDAQNSVDWEWKNCGIDAWKELRNGSVSK